MVEQTVWDKAQGVELEVSKQIKPEFDIGFDKQIPQDVQDELRTFVGWVEDHYRIPVTLWVNFEYKHYLVRCNGERVGYLFYWSDLRKYPVIENEEDIPIIRLPVRTEHSSIEEILHSFCEAITCYFAWVCNEIHKDYNTTTDADIILQKYLSDRK